jgi:hypothetical protein
MIAFGGTATAQQSGNIQGFDHDPDGNLLEFMIYS